MTTLTLFIDQQHDERRGVSKARVDGFSLRRVLVLDFVPYIYVTVWKFIVSHRIEVPKVLGTGIEVGLKLNFA